MLSRETEWLFKTRKGQLQLAGTASSNRLVVVHLMRNQVYGKMRDVQDELSDRVLELAPSKLPPNYKVSHRVIDTKTGPERERDPITSIV